MQLLSGRFSTDSPGDHWPFFVSGRHALAAAVALLLVLLTVHPGSASIFSGLQEAREYRTAVGLLKQGDYELAESQYRTFIKSYPESERIPRARFGLAEAYYLQGDYARAARSYLKSLKTGELSVDYRKQAIKRGLDAVNRSGHYGLGKKYLTLLDGSLNHLNDQSLRRLVQILSKNDQPSMALKWSKRALEDNQDSAYWQYETAVLQAEVGNYSRADELLKPLLQAESEFLNDAKFLAAELNYQRRNLKTAREYYSELTDDPDYGEQARYGLAWVDIKTQDISRAKQRLKSLATSSYNIRAQAARDLARIYRSENSDTAVRKWYRRAISWFDEPEQSKLLIEFGDYFVNTNRLAYAVPYYERANDLGLGGTKRLIRGYLLQNKYSKAARELEKLQKNGQLNDPVWKRRLALARFYLGNYKSALKVLPAADEAPNQNEKRRILSLEGTIHYRLGNWKKSRTVYNEMSQHFDGPEPRYYQALLSEKLHDKNNARKRLMALRKSVKDEPWRSRINYQLARLAYESKHYDTYTKYIKDVDTSRLDSLLRSEVQLLQLANQVRETPGDQSLIKTAKQLREDAAQFGQLNQWFGYLSRSNPPKPWWSKLLIPTLVNNPSLHAEFGNRAVSLLRQRNLLEPSFNLGQTLLDANPDTTTSRSIRAELLNTLRQQGNHRLIGRFLPVKSDWSNWTGQQLRSLGLALAHYHRSMDQPKAGYKSLVDLLEIHRPIETTLNRQFNEWIASFEIELERYQSAHERLRGVKPDKRTLTGSINLAAAEYHLGDTLSSLNRLTKLKQRTDTPPLALYDYAFRIMRDDRQSANLDRWSQEILARTDISETSTRSVLLGNIQYWINNGYSERALNYIDKLESRTRTNDALVELRYYRSMAHFNKDQLTKAADILASVRKSFSLNQQWIQRILRSEIEIRLRENDWAGGYDRWLKLHEEDLGAKPAERLLSAEGLNAYPDTFGQFLTIMEADYRKYYSDGQITYWKARLNQRQGNYRRAISNYRKYLSENFKNQRKDVRIRLANLHNNLGQHKKALKQYETLFEQTQDQQYQLKAGVQRRKLGQLNKSIKTLRNVVESAADVTPRAHYHLGYSHLEAGNGKKALKHFQLSLRSPGESASWTTDARRRAVELALRRRKPRPAGALLKELEAGPEKTLFRAELLRQTGKLGQASSLVESLSDTVKENSALRERYRSIASAIHWQNDDHRRLLEVYDTPPLEPKRRVWYALSSIETGNNSAVEGILPDLPEDARRRVRTRLADDYYSHSNWDSALVHYRKLPSSARNSFRIGNIKRKLDDPGAAYRVWQQGLNNVSDSANSKWINPIVDGLVVLTPELENWGKTAKLLDKHWTLSFKEKDEVALRGLEWSIRTDNQPLARRYVRRTTPDSSTFERIAQKLHSRGDWQTLNQWISRYRDTSGSAEDSLAFKYFQSSVELRIHGKSLDPAQLNDHLNRALQQQSSYAPKLQKLLGDYHFSQENYKQAAIEYRKIDLLFENTSPDPTVQLKLARSYSRMGRTEKARPLFEALTDKTTPESVRKEAQQWLTNNSDES
ncbi:MAG: tetratricopeptide repeat protein [bacterium]